MQHKVLDILYVQCYCKIVQVLLSIFDGPGKLVHSSGKSDAGATSPKNGIKQGGVLVPTPILVFFSIMPKVDGRDNVHTCQNGKLFYQKCL